MTTKTTKTRKANAPSAKAPSTSTRNDADLFGDDRTKLVARAIPVRSIAQRVKNGVSSKAAGYVVGLVRVGKEDGADSQWLWNKEEGRKACCPTCGAVGGLQQVDFSHLYNWSDDGEARKAAQLKAQELYPDAEGIGVQACEDMALRTALATDNVRDAIAMANAMLNNGTDDTPEVDAKRIKRMYRNASGLVEDEDMSEADAIAQAWKDERSREVAA